jgi:DNA-binding transcriptional ArsR family regulator
VAAKAKGQAKGDMTKTKRSKAAGKERRETASRSVDQRIIKALAHPLRVEILAILNNRVASPTELKKELGEGLSQVSYHVKVLKDYDMIELIREEPRRGAMEHFYRANTEVFIPSGVFKLLPKSAQRGVWGDVLADIEQDIGTAIETGTFDMRPDLVVGRDPRVLDGKGREAVEEAAADFFERFKEIEAETVNRRANGEGDGESIPTTAAVLVFGTVLGKNLRSNKGKRRKS